MTKQISRQNCVNCDNTDLATKQLNFSTKQIFSTMLLLLWRDLSCGEISPHNRFAPHFSILMWRHLSCEYISPHDRYLHITNFAPHLSRREFLIDFLHISHLEKLLHNTICHMEKFLHMTDLFSTSTACGACDKYQVCWRYLFRCSFQKQCTMRKL